MLEETIVRRHFLGRFMEGKKKKLTGENQSTGPTRNAESLRLWRAGWIVVVAVLVSDVSTCLLATQIRLP